MKTLLICLACFFAISFNGFSDEPSAATTHTYTATRYSAVRRLGVDLYNALKPKNQEFINVQPISMETDVMPFVKLDQIDIDDKHFGIVFISIGFIDLMNNVAHAKAIDTIEKGYFEKYIASLSKETGETTLQELPNISDKRFWSEDVMNEQLSNFNQMVGIVAATKLSHFYLGQYKKCVDKLTDASGKQISINNILTPSEYETALKAGVANGLECGFGVDGIKSLFDCIDKMQKRPAWTEFFLPKDAKVDKIKKELAKWEQDYFGK